MSREARIRARQEKLQGIDARRLLQRAAAELDAKGRANARVVEVDSRQPRHDERPWEVYYLEERQSDGSWRAYSTEDVMDQGCLDVRRADRENLEPALRWDMAVKLVRGAAFNVARDSIEYVRDKCVFRSAGLIEAGKVK